MADPGLKAVVGCGVAAGLLIALHFWRGSTEEVVAPKGAKPRTSNAALAEQGAAREREKWDAFKAKFQPDAGDTKQERDEKGLARTMQSFRAQPVEIVERPDSRGNGGIAVHETADIERVLAAGGTYTGPLPPELEPKDGDDR